MVQHIFEGLRLFKTVTKQIFSYLRACQAEELDAAQVECALNCMGMPALCSIVLILLEIVDIVTGSRVEKIETWRHF